MPGTSIYKVIGLCAALMLVVGIACGGTRSAESDSFNDPQSGLVVLSDQQGLVVFSLARDLGTGPNRIPITILRFDQSRVLDRASDLSVSYGLLNGEEERAVDEVTWRPWPFSGGVYTFVADFDTAGTWEIAVTLDDPGGEVTGTAAIQVRQEPLAPGVGSPSASDPNQDGVLNRRGAGHQFGPEPQAGVLPGKPRRGDRGGHAGSSHVFNSGLLPNKRLRSTVRHVGGNPGRVR